MKAGQKFGFVALLFFAAVVPVITVLFSKMGLDKYKSIRSELTLLKDSTQLVDFSVIAHNQDTLDREDVDGRVVIANYWSKDCEPKVVEQTFAEMKRIQREYSGEGEEKILFLTHVALPAEDTVGSLMPYLSRYAIDTTNWVFVKAANRDIGTVFKEVYQLDKTCAKLALADSRGYLCNHYETGSAETINGMMRHMTILVPTKSRKKLEYRAEKKLYE